MTTLADMTPEQREQCVGMWFDHPNLGLCVLSNVRKHGLAYVSFSRDAGATVHHVSELGFSEVTPRPDLPRAPRLAARGNARGDGCGRSGLPPRHQPGFLHLGRDHPKRPRIARRHHPRPPVRWGMGGSMSLTKPRIKVRSTLDPDGKRRWKVYEWNGVVSLPVGWPNHRTFRTWKAAHREADHYARNTKPRTQ